MIMAGYPTTVMDASHVPASYCPSIDAIAVADGTCPADVIVPANDRRDAWRATLFFGASARGVLNQPAL
jgi:hypothetical protein